MADEPRPLFAPWRLDYLEALDARERADPAAQSGSFLLDYFRSPGDDGRNHVIIRSAGEHPGLVLLNRYPYANGHLLVALGEARPRLLDYMPAQRAALWRLTDAALEVLEHALNPQGVNIGVNQGRAAGAGVPSHLHVHLVPRWGGDVNFMSVVPRVRVIPSSLEAMAARMRASWSVLRGRVGPLL